MNTKYTPGPWQVSQYATTVNGPDGGPVASAMMLSEERISDAEQHANAHLIAAAPELLAALEDAEFLLRKAGQLAGPMRDSFNRSAQDARAAIAKATGQQ